MSTPTSSPAAWFDSEVDPLVPPPHEGLNAWAQRFSATWRRSWRSLVAIFLLTFTAPTVAAAFVLNEYAGGAVQVAGALPIVAPNAWVDLGVSLPTLLGILLLISLVTLFVNAVGWAGAIWAVTHAAIGLPVTVGAALQAGLHRVWSMFGWYLLFTVLVTVGLFACLLPGIYVAIAGSLFSFAVVYERGRNPLARSFTLVHRGFGAAVGRVLLLAMVVMTIGCAASVLNLSLGLSPTEVSPGRPVAAAVVDGLVSVPVTMVLLVGLLLTYTQLRAAQEQLTTGQLWTAANPEPA